VRQPGAEVSLPGDFPAQWSRPNVFRLVSPSNALKPSSVSSAPLAKNFSSLSRWPSMAADSSLSGTPLPLE